MKRYPKVAILAVFSTALIGFKCGSSTNEDKKSPQSSEPTGYTVKAINAYPHDNQAFTQGLLFRDGFLYESTGLYGRSSLRKVDLTTGEVQFQLAVPAQYFAEGLTYFGGKFYQLTWKEQIALAYTEESNAFKRETAADFDYDGEGWGLTNDDNYLIMSNGSATLTFLNPETMKAVKTITVKDGDLDVRNLNELEYIDGKIWANVWQKNILVVIDPLTGAVTQTIDVDPRALFADTDGVESSQSFDSVLNGIAYDSATKRLFITGKNWSKLFEVEVVAQ